MRVVWRSIGLLVALCIVGGVAVGQVNACMSDSECASGWTCIGEQPNALPYPVPGSCQQQECWINVCQFPNECNGDICMPAPVVGGCTTSSQCGSGQCCNNGTCGGCEQKSCNDSYKVWCPSGTTRQSQVLSTRCVQKGQLYWCSYLLGSAQTYNTTLGQFPTSPLGVYNL
jgi:hypothetical protein